LKDLEREMRRKGQKGRADNELKASIAEAKRIYEIADEKGILYQIQKKRTADPKNENYIQRETECVLRAQELEGRRSSRHRETQRRVFDASDKLSYHSSP
jgi:hypothetical protein